MVFGGVLPPVGETVKELGIARLLVLVDDPEAEMIAAGALGIPTQCFNTHEDLLQHLNQLVLPGDRLLFKASNSVGLGKVVAGLNKNSEE